MRDTDAAEPVAEAEGESVIVECDFCGHAIAVPRSIVASPDLYRCTEGIEYFISKECGVYCSRGCWADYCSD